MADLINLTEDYDYAQFRYSGNASIVDATGASWILANTGSRTNTYPVLFDDAADGVEAIGGTIAGEVSQTASWSDIYVNSAAVMVRDTPDATIRDWTISRPWDGIRVVGDSEGFEIVGVEITEARDDAVENDDGLSGTIRDSVFDGVFSGISLGDRGIQDRTDARVDIDNVQMRMETYLYEGEETHGSPMKMVKSSPHLTFTDSVLAIEEVDHLGYGRLQAAWDKTIEASGNTFLNLSDDPLPESYPVPGDGWTILEGQEARDYWKAARAGDLPVPNSATGSQSGAGKTSSNQSELSGSFGTAKADGVVFSEDGGDRFVFDTLPETDGEREIDGFEPGVDKILLDHSAFDAIEFDARSGVLAPEQFLIGKQPADGDDHVMYEWRTGEVFYDQDGIGDTEQVRIAQLDQYLDLSHDDVLVI